jgi:hypothetical protein
MVWLGVTVVPVILGAISGKLGAPQFVFWCALILWMPFWIVASTGLYMVWCSGPSNR